MSPFYEADSERGENLFMAECAKCGEWYHKCLKIFSPVFANKSIEWKCNEILKHNIKIEKKNKKKKVLYFSS